MLEKGHDVTTDPVAQVLVLSKLSQLVSVPATTRSGMDRETAMRKMFVELMR